MDDAAIGKQYFAIDTLTLYHTIVFGRVRHSPAGPREVVSVPPGSMSADPILSLLPSETERARYQTLLSTLSKWKALFIGRRVLDFGASWGTSAVALIRSGASEVIGVEPSLSRVEQGRELVIKAVPAAKVSIICTPDTTALPFVDEEFAFILANGVLEHIPQPRDPYIRELWRVVATGGHLMISETPNKYFPKDVHTTSLWFNHWLPRRLAHHRAVRRRRFDPSRTDWDSSGWRGLGYFEIVRPLAYYRLIPERTKLRHRLLPRVGLPASLIDPGPIWVLQKTRSSQPDLVMARP
jgi:SAM-dependent methyltransferase